MRPARGAYRSEVVVAAGALLLEGEQGATYDPGWVGVIIHKII